MYKLSFTMLLPFTFLLSMERTGKTHAVACNIFVQLSEAANFAWHKVVQYCELSFLLV